MDILTARYAITAPADLRTDTDAWRRVVYVVLSVFVALVGAFLLFLSCLATIRGLLFGFIVDDYSTSWGGPSLTGAWLVHLLGVLCLPVAVGLLIGLSALQKRLRARLLDGAGPPWAIPCAIVLALLGVLLVRSWLHQAG